MAETPRDVHLWHRKAREGARDAVRHLHARIDPFQAFLQSLLVLAEQLARLPLRRIMNETIHKANYKAKVNAYAGLGQYELVPTTECRGAKGYYSKRPPRGFLARNWKDVTCKNCLKHRQQ